MRNPDRKKFGPDKHEEAPTKSAQVSSIMRDTSLAAHDAFIEEDTRLIFQSERTGSLGRLWECDFSKYSPVLDIGGTSGASDSSSLSDLDSCGTGGASGADDIETGGTGGSTGGMAGSDGYSETAEKEEE